MSLKTEFGGRGGGGGGGGVDSVAALHSCK